MLLRKKPLTCCLLFAGLLIWLATPGISQDWPREIEAPNAKVIVYQPQLEKFDRNILEARTAVSVTMKEKSEPVFGAIWIRARVKTDFSTRMVSLESVRVTAVKFPNAKKEHEEKLISFLEKEIPKWDLRLSLDRLLAAMELVQEVKAVDQGLKHVHPKIILATEPSVLVLIDGEPKLKKIENTSLQYVLNTPYFIVLDPSQKKYYLKGGAYWFASQKVLGPWQQTTRIPSQVAKLAEKMEEQRKKQQEDLEKEQKGEISKTKSTVVPKIIISTKPVELILTDGKPKLAPIQGTQLLYVTNTENDILMDIKSQKYYILISGRWYTSPSLLSNKWNHISPDKISADFAKIPPESDMGNILAHVAGTQQAKESLLENAIPKTAEVDRNKAGLKVKYDGSPKFENIKGVDMAYAVNTQSAVFKIKNRYYGCEDAVWYEANSPNGPYSVCVKVPPEIQKIPPSNPHYNVKYVYVYDYTPKVVHVGYTPGYSGSYIYNGCVVYGTGWMYSPWWGPYYYPRMVTWGFGVHWNPWTGWGFHAGYGFGWFRAGWGVGFGPWWGPMPYRYGYRAGFHHGFWRGYRAAHYRRGYRPGYPRISPYRGRGRYPTVYHKPRPGVRTPKVSPYRPKSPGKQMTPKRYPNNVYSNKKGNVYRNQGNQWQQKTKKGWSSYPSAQKTQRSNLNRQSQSRQRGNSRTQNYRSSSRSGSRRRR